MRVLGIKERIHEPFYTTLLTPEAQAKQDALIDATVHWCMPADVAALDEAWAFFDNVELDAPGLKTSTDYSKMPVYLEDAEEGDYWASGYMKGQMFARGRTPDEAARRLCDQLAERGDNCGWEIDWEPHILRSVEAVNNELRMPG